MRGGQFLHWIRYCLKLDRARTQTTEAEREAIRHHASGRRHAVELGVFEGVTALVIREAMSPAGVLTCIDPFGRGRLGIDYGLSISRREIARSGNGEVRLLFEFSAEAARDWALPVDFLFVDADHSEEGVRADWAGWSPHIVAGGIVAFHDSTDESKSPGPSRLVREIEQSDAGFLLMEQVDSLTIFRRQ